MSEKSTSGLFIATAVGLGLWAASTSGSSSPESRPSSVDYPTPAGAEQCYEATVGEYGSTTVSGAVVETLIHEAGIVGDELEKINGRTETARVARIALLDKHVTYDYVMPGDVFGICIAGQQVSLQPDSIRANDN